MDIIVTATERRPGVWLLHWHGQRYHREHNRTVHGDAAAAEAARAAWEADLAANGAPVFIRSTTPLAEVIREQYRYADHAPETVALRERVLRLYIDPPIPARRQDILIARAAWGDVPGAELPGGGFPVNNPIGRRQVGRIAYGDGVAFQQHMIDRFRGRGGSRTIAEAMRLCVSALSHAVQKGAIAANPWADIPRVGYRGASVTVPTSRADVENAIEAAGHDTRVGMVIRLALATGARRGELLALRWRHIDLAAAKMRIEASLDHRDGEFTLRPTKSTSGRRVTPLPEPIMDELRAWHAEAARYALANGLPIAELPVIRGDDGGYWSPNTASQAVRRALHAAGLPASLHAKRHWHASTLLSQRVNAETVRRQMGHRDITTTLRHYAHAMPGDDAAVSAAIGDGMTGKIA